MNTTHLAYLSLGSNLGYRPHNLQKAVIHISEIVGKIVNISSIYETSSVGFDGEDFLNLCLAVSTELDPNELLEEVLKIETAMGRVRDGLPTYQSRTIDIDLLYFDGLVLHSEDLVLPHPRMHERNFVLKPLADIAPQFYHPILKKDTRNLLMENKDRHKVRKTTLLIYRDRPKLFGAMQHIAIEGNIGAGKTLLANKMSKDFNAKLLLERFADNAFLPKFYKDPLRYAFTLEMSFLADRYQQFTEDATQLDLFKNCLISDYEVSKSLIFAQVTLQKEEFELYRRLFKLMYVETKKPGLYIYLHRSTDNLLANIKKRGRAYERNIDREYLKKINMGYLNFLKTVPKKRKLVINIDGMDFLNNKNDYQRIVDVIETKIMNELVYL